MTLALLLTFLGAAALVLGLAALLEQSPARARLMKLHEGLAPAAAANEPGGILVEEEPSWALRALARLGGRGADPANPALSTVRKRLVVAGYRRPSSVRVYMGARVAAALALPLLAVQASVTQDLDSVRFAALVVFAAGLGWVLPSFLLDGRIRARQRRIELGLPDALDLMVVCIEAGLGLHASISRVAAQYADSNRELAQEFELVSLEAHAGKSNVEALRGLADRTGLAEVSALVAMLIQTERFGTSVADALRVHGSSMRQRRMQVAEESAAKAPIKMLLPAAIFIFPATLLVVAGPGVISLIATLQGS